MGADCGSGARHSQSALIIPLFANHLRDTNWVLRRYFINSRIAKRLEKIVPFLKPPNVTLQSRSAAAGIDTQARAS